MAPTRTRSVVLIWVAGVLLATATIKVLEFCGVPEVFAETAGMGILGIAAWFWLNQRAQRPGQTGVVSFRDWTAWWLAAAILIAALRVQGWF